MNKLIIISIIIFLVIMSLLIINIYKKNKYINYLMIFFMFLSLILIISTELMFIDNVLYYIIRYIFYPTTNNYHFTLFISILIIIYTLYSKNLDNKSKIFNYMLFLIIIDYIIFSLLKIDFLNYKSLYNGLSLICLRFSSILFVLWLLVTLCRLYYKKVYRRE